MFRIQRTKVMMEVWNGLFRKPTVRKGKKSLKLRLGALDLNRGHNTKCL